MVAYAARDQGDFAGVTDAGPHDQRTGTSMPQPVRAGSASAGPLDGESGARNEMSAPRRLGLPGRGVDAEISVIPVSAFRRAEELV